MSVSLSKIEVDDMVNIYIILFKYRFNYKNNFKNISFEEYILDIISNDIIYKNLPPEGWNDMRVEPLLIGICNRLSNSKNIDILFKNKNLSKITIMMASLEIRHFGFLANLTDFLTSKIKTGRLQFESPQDSLLMVASLTTFNVPCPALTTLLENIMSKPVKSSFLVNFFICFGKTNQKLPPNIVEHCIKLLSCKEAILSSSDIVKFFSAVTQMRLRKSETLTAITDRLRNIKNEYLTLHDNVNLLYNYYLSDVWVEDVIRTLKEPLEKASISDIDSFTTTENVKLLISLAYFSIGSPEIYFKSLAQICRNECLLTEWDKDQLKIFEVLARSSSLSIDLLATPQGIQDMLFRIRQSFKDTVPKENFTRFETVINSLVDVLYVQVNLGPYFVNVVKLSAEDDDTGVFYLDPYDKRSATIAFLIESNGKNDFYHQSHQWTSETKMRHRILSILGLRVIHLPYFDWNALDGTAPRRLYIRKLIENLRKRPVPPGVRFEEQLIIGLMRQNGEPQGLYKRTSDTPSSTRTFGETLEEAFEKSQINSEMKVFTPKGLYRWIDDTESIGTEIEEIKKIEKPVNILQSTRMGRKTATRNRVMKKDIGYNQAWKPGQLLETDKEEEEEENKKLTDYIAKYSQLKSVSTEFRNEIAARLQELTEMTHDEEKLSTK
eukprot:GHVL01033603.1.p1 GENE.GHVL01033603.1~~GHVL01033603.1.p1  ORF type:complete len:665 (-),score=170.90 GHVL01033603.1:511-2505(-)